ncbi:MULTISPECIES: electron transfer flavoprotein subunit alpha [Chromohalobacter]|uniref:Electron transfer flavoprotein subunit alpha/FixB family protein n=2 Tax=Chromohalobacter TaxID=42054 RepID=A0A9X3B2M1_9GAMM|nr:MULTISPECIES: electron transfer flavoprotein subunit alpha/FixB family protein [Chromohalobacter]MCK0768500.1 electron transfer flavoprotein subunit alpha/FixB family protein [Chromohalobacter canadensis]MCT8467459.1 electron transfer flavoprotein subunit alpha/FixB family protein [Chromohalobacter canadensis]MCT8470793.1 electron transfer flavoprotein subunit alpha/FixB family protein [Chromohalobacter canadensis]MCT8497956.1 electron transfer flavoprotein subunit alpha/FixB family protein 
MSDLPRRDPRQEWIARNRLHPRHGDVLASLGQGAASEWQGPHGLMRRNPHAVGFIGPNGVKRIDRSGTQQGAGGRAETPNAERKPLVEIDAPAFLVAVVPDMAGGRLSGHDRDLLGLARQLADADHTARGVVVAVIFGPHKETSFGEAGVDRLLHLDSPEVAGYAPEARLGALIMAEQAWAPRHWLLPDSKLGGGELGRRLAARLGERSATGVWQVAADAEASTGWHCTARGAAGSLDIRRPLPRVALALAECAEPVSETRHAAAELALPQPLPSTLSRIQDLGQVSVDPSGVALSEAEFILSAGNGVKDWQGFHHAAEVLGATEGASRVAVDDGFMARDRQVGATGTWVTARVYVAVGISGAIQHLQGIQTCEKVVAINMDPGCDMIKRADLAVIGDSAQILEALVTLVAQAREEKRHAA